MAGVLGVREVRQADPEDDQDVPRVQSGGQENFEGLLLALRVA